MILLFVMILLHIIDDFVLQFIILNKLKQKEWWYQSGAFNNDDNSYNWHKFELYKNDYKMALIIHSLSWSIMICLPYICISLYEFIITKAFLTETCGMLIFMIILNTIVHYFVDDLKANHERVNLIEDQFIHLVQIFLIFAILYCVYFL